jgi:homoserine O-acetyltransferase
MSNLKHIAISGFTTHTGRIVDISLSYQTFGLPLGNAPIVLVNHALTGNSNVIGENGWWNDLIGDHKCIDTNEYTVLAFNIPGNGYDGNLNHLIENYKDFNAKDIARLFAEGLKQLRIDHLFAVIGGSVGGGLAWELAALEPNLIDYLIPIATDWKSTDWVIANCHIQDAILNNSSQPLADARRHAMTLYRTPESLTEKFNRTKRTDELYNIESWLNHHGKVLSNRFHLEAYKMMNQVLRTINVAQTDLDFKAIAKKITAHIHIVTINSDLLFKPEENWKTFVDLKSVKDDVTIGEIKSIHGHDAFLMEFQQLSKLLKPVFAVKQKKMTA